MKTKATYKTLNELRKVQKESLENVTKRLYKIENQIRNWFKNTPFDVRHSMSAADYDKATHWKERRELEKEKAFLETELIEKKYANELLFSDINPYEVIEEKTANKYLIRKMKCTETEASKQARAKSFIPGGFCGRFDNDVQEWEIVPDETAPILAIRRHKDGFFYLNHIRFSITSEPVKHYDFNF